MACAERPMYYINTWEYGRKDERGTTDFVVRALSNDHTDFGFVLNFMLCH